MATCLYAKIIASNIGDGLYFITCGQTFNLEHTERQAQRQVELQAASGAASSYRSGTVNSNTVNSKFHLIRSYCEIFFYHFLSISCLKCTVNSNFHLIRSKTLPMNDFELNVPDL